MWHIYKALEIRNDAHMTLTAKAIAASYMRSRIVSRLCVYTLLVWCLVVDVLW